MTNYASSNIDEANFQGWKKRMEDECKAKCEEAISSITAHYGEIILHAQEQHDAKMRLLEAKNHNRGIDCTDIDVCAHVFAYFMPKELMIFRRVCKSWEEAAKKTTVALNSYFKVDSVAGYNAMSVMTRALPNLQQITIGYLGQGHKYGEGEDPNPMWVRTSHWTTHDIEIISNFSKLRVLSIYGSMYSNSLLNGRYPVLFNSFPLLQILSIHDCKYLKWDLEMLAGMPLLKRLDCWNNPCLTGNISSLRVLKDTLERVKIYECQNVEGNLMDLADFPHLKMLQFVGTAVTGDIRDIGENDFYSLEYLNLPEYEFQSIDDVPDVARAVHLVKKQHPALTMYWCGKLSEDSPDWYESMNMKYPPPFFISFVQAGSRIGYRWESGCWSALTCEVNWLDPEPSRGRESSVDGKYTEELQKIEKEWQEKGRVDLYKGIHQPPTEEEYHRLLEEYDLLPNTT